MEAKDLMIGDWVFDEQMGIPVPVCSIREGRECLCRPIPLTPEILKKNGFKDTDIVVLGTRKFHWRSEDERMEITIWFDDTMPMEIVKNVYYEDEVSYTLPFPWSVNMLQHALRLCGIDKEIVI